MLYKKYLGGYDELYKSVISHPDPGYGAFLSLDPGSGIGFFRIPDLGSRIPNPCF
jgi:hypothetical protein